MPNYYVLVLMHARVLIKLNRLNEAEIIINQEQEQVRNGEVSHFSLQLTLAQMEYLLQQQKVAEAYNLVKQSVELFEQEPKWLVKLYSELCKLSKLCNSATIYLNDLKALAV